MANTILEEKWEGNYYLKLKSEFDSRLAMANIHSALLVEDFNFNSPMFIIRFTDALGDLITHNRISPDAEYRLISGVNEQNAMAFDYSLSKNKFQTQSPGKPENILSQIYFISSQWKELIGIKRHRSWNQVRYSEVVREIANNLGFDEIDIEETDGVFNVIQPGWTDYQLMKWIVKRAVNSDGIGGFELGFTANGRFIFKTNHELNDQRPIKSFYFVGEDNPEDEDRPHFFNFEIVQDYADLVKQAASGYRYGYYDFENKKYIKEEKLLSDTDQRQLSDWTYVAESHEGPDNFYYGGRELDTPEKIQNRILTASNSIQKVKIDIKGDMSIHIGDIVKLYISPTEHSKKPINEFYSGHYMVTKVSHEFQFGQTSFITQLQLSRQGINGNDVEGFVETSAGKQIRK